MVREIIKLKIFDIVVDFLGHDRKEDQDLTAHAIETAIREGVVSKAEIVEWFKEYLDEAIP